MSWITQLFPSQRMVATFTVKPSVNYPPTLLEKLSNAPLVVGDTVIIYPASHNSDNGFQGLPPVSR